MKFLKRVTNGEIDWVAKVPENTQYYDTNVIEITEKEFEELSKGNVGLELS